MSIYPLSFLRLINYCYQVDVVSTIDWIPILPKLTIGLGWMDCQYLKDESHRIIEWFRMGSTKSGSPHRPENLILENCIPLIFSLERKTDIETAPQ